VVSGGEDIISKELIVLSYSLDDPATAYWFPVELSVSMDSACVLGGLSEI
jgi:hypothetical protein